MAEADREFQPMAADIRVRVKGLGFRDATPIMQNQVEKNMENEMKTVVRQGFIVSAKGILSLQPLP